MTQITHALWQKLRWEALRAHESHGVFHTSTEQANQIATSADQPFENKLIIRSDFLDTNQIVSQQLRLLFQRSGLITTLVLLASLILGGFAASALVNNDARVLNFYWLLIALLGVHLVTFLVWLVSITVFDVPSPIHFIWQQLHTWLQPRNANKHTTLSDALKVDQALKHSTFYSWSHYLSVTKPGKWWFYTVMHSYWLVFLLGALIYIIAVMSTRQYQFIWETTILPPHWFAHLTTALAWLPEQLGFQIPSAMHIEGSQRTPSMDSASAWASLLTASVLLYGILPRGVAAIICLIAYRRSRQRWQPDFNLPYYRRLRQQLTPAQSQIVDADEHAPVFDELPLWQHADISLSNTQTYVQIGLEMATQPTMWPLQLQADTVMMSLGVTHDAASFARIHAQVEANQYTHMIIACHLNTLPDRGLLRMLKSFLAHKPEHALLVLSKHALRLDDAEIKQRFDDWLHVALQAGLSAKDVIIYDFH